MLASWMCVSLMAHTGGRSVTASLCGRVPSCWDARTDLAELVVSLSFRQHDADDKFLEYALVSAARRLAHAILRAGPSSDTPSLHLLENFGVLARVVEDLLEVWRRRQELPLPRDDRLPPAGMWHHLAEALFPPGLGALSDHLSGFSSPAGPLVLAWLLRLMARYPPLHDVANRRLRLGLSSPDCDHPNKNETHL